MEDEVMTKLLNKKRKAMTLQKAPQLAALTRKWGETVQRNIQLSRECKRLRTSL